MGAVGPGEDVFAYVARVRGHFDLTLYRQVVGAANEFKEGDQLAGLAAADDGSRTRARELLSNTRVGDLAATPLFEDAVYDVVRAVDPARASLTASWTLGRLRDFLLSAPEDEIKAIRSGLVSDVIGCVVKLMDNAELVAVSSKIFDALPGSRIGAKGYMGARVQPNSPTDDPDDIRWQVFDAWAYGVGDVLLGTNPVSSEVASVARIETTLRDILVTFGLDACMPHCVLAHIDVQAAVEELDPGSTALWFQSLGGTEGANATFGLTIPGLLEHASRRTGRYGLYFETGQGADGTNGHGSGFDMVVHESRKYGLARALRDEVAEAQVRAGAPPAPWVHLNDVAGFIGPEVFRTREQLVRCCLEDLVMGKLHGLTIGLDICSTLHMDVDLRDLDWCIDQVMPANPAYLMALPTKNDPMLSYLTTGYQDHVRIRYRFGYRVNDAMWDFFQRLGVVDEDGEPGPNFGHPAQIYLSYRRAKGDSRSDSVILDEGRGLMESVRGRGVWLAEGHGAHPWDLEGSLAREIDTLYADAKACIWAELTPEFVASVPGSVWLRSCSADRDDYIGHPKSGERLTDESLDVVRRLRTSHDGRFNVQIVVSDGLNAHAVMDQEHVLPYLAEVRQRLATAGHAVAPETVVLSSGRVRAGYQLGEVLFGETGRGPRAILHVIGERPGSGHRSFSVYITAPDAATWAQPGRVDHDITRVVSGISDTTLTPARAAQDTARLLGELCRAD